MDDLRHQFQRLGFGGDWDVAPAAHGSTGRAFVARQGGESLFIKLGPPHPALERLSALGVTPPILAHLALHERDGRDLTVYQHIDANAADRAWIGAHADVLVDLFNVVQQDSALTGLLGSVSPVTTIDEHLEAVVTRLIARVERASAPVFGSSGIGAALARLHTVRPPVSEVPLVPAHTDPSPSNVLVAFGRIYLVDWDGIILSDPMRDIGLLLWWCVPTERWGALLRRFWLPDADSAACIDRVYWWSAVNSLRVALWIDRHTSDEGAIASFLEDFLAAEARCPNPKRVA